MVNSVKHLALNKMPPPIQGLFFQEEALSVSQEEGCTHYRVRMVVRRIYSSEKALLTANKEEKYNILKEQLLSTKSLGTRQLQAKYSFKKDPGVLIDNAKEVKACKIRQKRGQLKNNTLSQ